jgi:hypothetical protein
MKNEELYHFHSLELSNYDELTEQQQELIQSEIPDLIVNASGASKLMTYKSVDKIDGTTLSYLKEKVIELMFGYKQKLFAKPVYKGVVCEVDSIDLLNIVEGKEYYKHEGRATLNGFTGECDIYTPELIRDIKTVWSIDQFPFFKDDAEAAIKKAGYEWQLRVYMMLYDVQKSCLDYCLVDTPENLIGYEDSTAHRVDFIPEKHRVTTVYFDRDEKLENLLLHRHKLANIKFKELVIDFFKTK